MPVTPLFAGIFGLIYIWLSYGVIKLRLNKKISLGSGGDEELEIAMRVHSNFIEYVPICLILLWFLEIVTYSSGLSFILACVLILARLAHIIGLNDTGKKFIFRQIGVLGTFTVILVPSVVLIWFYLPF